MSYDSITNRGDYLSPHYLAEVLPRDLNRSHTSLFLSLSPTTVRL